MVFLRELLILLGIDPRDEWQAGQRVGRYNVAGNTAIAGELRLAGLKTATGEA
jgi:hypothetical protein